MSGTTRTWAAPGVLLVDSITQLEPGDAGAVAVSGSHGGVSSAQYALAVPLRLAVFNDAGIGKDEAGVAASGGSSCASGALERSHVVAALGPPASGARTTLRLSLGGTTTDAEVAHAAEAIPAAVRRLREAAA